MRAKRGTTIIIGLAMGSLLAGPAMAQSDTPPENHALYGISGENDKLMRYDFVDGGYESLGAVRMHDTGQQLKGIRAMAHIPRMTNLFGFWINPDTGLTRLVFINANTVEAAVEGTDLGDGPITGAAAAPETAEEPAPDEQTSSQTISEYTLYAVQWRLPWRWCSRKGSSVPSRTSSSRSTTTARSISGLLTTGNMPNGTARGRRRRSIRSPKTGRRSRLMRNRARRIVCG